MNFSYTARRLDGNSTSGTLVAECANDARQMLRQQGVFVLTLTAEAKAAIGQTPTRAAASFDLRNRVSRSDVVMLTSQLAIMSQSGVELAEAIENLAQTSTRPALQDALTSIRERLEQGVQLSDALKEFPAIFDEVYVSAVRAGEASGRMTAVLQRLSSMLRNEQRMKSAIVGALTYPGVLLLISSVVLFAVVFFVLPQFAKVFADIGVTPPATTAILLDFGEFIRGHMLISFGSMAMAVAGIIFFARTRTFQYMMDHMWLNQPVTRTAARSLTTGRVFRLLSTMLTSGLPLLETLQLCSRSVRSPQFRNLMDVLVHEVTLGHMIGPILAKSHFLPPGAAQMVITGERTGQLSEVFEMVGEYYEEEGERQLKERVKLLEPAVIVVMGVMVGFIVASVMLPLFEFSSASRAG